MKIILLLLGLTAIAAASECPDGWIESREADVHRCYRFVEEAENWDDAREMCRTAKADLLSILSEEEKEWVVMKVNDYSTRRPSPIWHWWSGLKLDEVTKNWQWSDGTHTTEELIMWQPSQPDSRWESEKCGEFHRTGMNDNNCNNAFAYICTKAKSQPSSPCAFGEVETGGICSKIVTKRPTAPPKAGIEPVQGACAEGWVESPVVEDRCYRFETVQRSWHDAKSLCEYAHGELVSLRSTPEKDWVRGQVQRLGQETSAWFGLYSNPARPSWWTGLNKIGSTYHGKWLHSNWHWADGQQADEAFIEWQSGEPNTYGSEECGELHINGFNDNQCTNQYPFICARRKSYVPENDCAFGEHREEGNCVRFVSGQTARVPVTTPIPSHVPVQGDCPEGWESSSVIQDRCYRFEKEKKLSWIDAQKMCQSARGELVSFRNAAELEWVKRVVGGITRPWNWWSGLNRRGSDATWRWSDETPFAEENVLWQPNEPNNIMERCGEWYKTGMNDNGCWKKYNFICARDKNLIKNAIECPFGQVLMGRLCEDLVIPTPPPAPAGACTDGWVEGAATPGTCYRFVTDTLSASDAKLMCRAAEGDLVVIKSDLEQEWLRQQVEREAQRTGQWEFYIGLEEKSNKWQWVDGSEVSDITTLLKGSNTYGTCSTMLPAGMQRDQCYSSKAYICSRPTELDPDLHVCPWGEIWKDERCQHYELHNYMTRVDYVHSTSLDVNDVQDKLQHLKGKHEREIESLRKEFSWQIGNLTKRIQVLEGALKISPSEEDEERPIRDFDPSLTLVISHFPEGLAADPLTAVRTFFSDVLGVPDAEVIHASRYGGRGRNPPKIKVLMADQNGKRAVMAARKTAKANPIYKDIRIVAAPMRLRKEMQ